VQTEHSDLRDLLSQYYDSINSAASPYESLSSGSELSFGYPQIAQPPNNYDPQLFITPGTVSTPGFIAQPPQPIVTPVQTVPQQPRRGRLNFLNKPDPLGDRTQWTPEEIESNRRLVRFQISGLGQRNAVMHVKCYPITQEDYREGMITISAIRWKPTPGVANQNRFSDTVVFTSVDLIILMEKIMDYPFSVQEKNKIRRNLETFRPETVKKNGTTLYFFHQLMNYINPKVRNIEKDIKVYPWADVTRAIKKVSQKYIHGLTDPEPTGPTNRNTTVASPVPPTQSSNSFSPVMFQPPLPAPTASPGLSGPLHIPFNHPANALSHLMSPAPPLPPNPFAPNLSPTFPTPPSTSNSPFDYYSFPPNHISPIGQPAISSAFKNHTLGHGRFPNFAQEDLPRYANPTELTINPRQISRNASIPIAHTRRDFFATLNSNAAKDKQEEEPSTEVSSLDYQAVLGGLSEAEKEEWELYISCPKETKPE
jgi:hypothetical protein